MSEEIKTSFVRLYWEAGGFNDYDNFPGYEVPPHTRIDYVAKDAQSKLSPEDEAFIAVHENRLAYWVDKKCESAMTDIADFKRLLSLARRSAKNTVVSDG